MGRFQCLAQGRFDKNSVLVVVSSFGGDATWHCLLTGQFDMWQPPHTNDLICTLYPLTEKINSAECIDQTTSQTYYWVCSLFWWVTVLCYSLQSLQEAFGLLWTLCLSACLHFLSLVLQSFNLCINPLWLHSPESYCITSVSSPLFRSPLLLSLWHKQQGCWSVDRFLMLLTDAI